jgi:hypothetical protein
MEDGVWRTISGRRVFIKTGQSLTEAMRESGKFTKKDSDDKIKSKGIDKMKKPTREEIQKDIDELNDKLEEGFTYGEGNKEFNIDSDYSEAIDEINEFYNDIKEVEPDDVTDSFTDQFGIEYDNYEEYLESWENERWDAEEEFRTSYNKWQSSIGEDISKLNSKINKFVEEGNEVDLYENFITNGTAWKVYLEAFSNGDEDGIKRMTSALQVSKFRHEKTDYDTISKKGLTQEQIAEIRKEHNY